MFVGISIMIPFDAERLRDTSDFLFRGKYGTLMMMRVGTTKIV